MRPYTRYFAGLLSLILLISLIPAPLAAAATSANCAAPTGEHIAVMSYNVLDECDPNSEGVYPYASPAEREDAIANMLKAYQPDIIGVQEAGDGGLVDRALDWPIELNKDLGDIYGYRSLKDDTGLKMHIARGLVIFYKKSRFTFLDSDAASYAQPDEQERCYQWVKLRDNQTNVEFYVFNTHWHVDGSTTLEENETVRTSEMEEFANLINTIAKDKHAFVVGDFNSFYSPKNSKGDTVNITRLIERTGFKDALIEATPKQNVNATGYFVEIDNTDNGLLTSADHVLYPSNLYTPLKLRRILSRTYTPMLSDHNAVLVDFNYLMPSLSATATEGELEAYYANGAYYIDNLSKRTTDLSISVQLSDGTIYSDQACTQKAGTSLTMKNGSSSTYRSENTYYIKLGSRVYPLYLRNYNANVSSDTIYVDQALANKSAGETGLYCDKYYGRLVTVGVNGFATIQEAVDKAPDGYKIMVAPGTYKEDVTYSGKSLHFYGSNRNTDALVMKNGQLSVNTGRTYETYLSGSITFAFGSLQTGSIMVNGFHFIDRTTTGQIRITGGNAKKTVDLQISNNLFNCYTDGAASNGSAILANSALQKTGSIVDNYFHLTKIPTYKDESGTTVNYTNRAITMRNMKDMTIHANYFDGYKGNKVWPFWLSS